MLSGAVCGEIIDELFNFIDSLSPTAAGANPGSPVWQSALVVIAHNLWKHYADKAFVAELYPGLSLFIDYLNRNADPASGLVLFGGLGDWVRCAAATQLHLLLQDCGEGGGVSTTGLFSNSLHKSTLTHTDTPASAGR